MHTLVQDLVQDLRFGWRMLVKNPGVTVVAVLSLAVGIGLNSTIFSLIDQVNAQHLPVKDPTQVYRITGSSAFLENTSCFAFLDRIELRDQCHALADVMALNDESVITDYLDLPRRLHAKVVSRNYFTFLGLRPALGRFFTEADGPELESEPLVVISYSLWQRDFGGDPKVIGKSIQLNGQTVTVIGVAQKGYFGTESYAPEDLWFPAETYYARQPKILTQPTWASFQLMTRLRPGMTHESAMAEVSAVVDRLAQSFPTEARSRRLHLSPLARARDVKFYLLGAANMILPGAVLAIACANVAGLLYARARTRVREVAVRMALGSGRWRLVRQMLSESLLLSLAGGGVGLLLAKGLMTAFPHLLPPLENRPFPDLYLDARMVMFTVVLALLATLLFGLMPAWYTTKLELTPLLKSETAAGSGGRPDSGLNLLVIGQLVVSLVLLSMGGLFLRSYWHQLDKQAGLQRPDLLLVEMKPEQYGMKRDQLMAYAREVRDRIQDLSGVRQASIAGGVPLAELPCWNRSIYVPGRNAGPSKKGQRISCLPVDERLLRLMNLRVLSGREISAGDVGSKLAIALVSQAAARAFWPNENPVGQVIRIGDANGEACEIVGVVEDGDYNHKHEAHEPYLFFPVAQDLLYSFTLLVETAIPPRYLIGPVREELRRINDQVRPVALQTLHDRVRSTHGLFGPKLMASIFGAVGLLGLILATVGLYAVVAYAVSQRTHEIGVRIAVGADRRDILVLVLKRGLKLALIGMVIGLPLAFGVAQLIRSGLFGFQPADPWTFLAVTVILLVVALLASLLPAWQAAQVDPQVALRCE